MNEHEKLNYVEWYLDHLRQKLDRDDPNAMHVYSMDFLQQSLQGVITALDVSHNVCRHDPGLLFLAICALRRTIKQMCIPCYAISGLLS